MEAIVCSQFPEVAAMGEAVAAIAEYSSMIDPHIWGAVLFALIGFSLVTGIELAGKKISAGSGNKTQAQ